MKKLLVFITATLLLTACSNTEVSGEKKSTNIFTNIFSGITIGSSGISPNIGFGIGIGTSTTKSKVDKDTASDKKVEVDKDNKDSKDSKDHKNK